MPDRSCHSEVTTSRRQRRRHGTRKSQNLPPKVMKGKIPIGLLSFGPIGFANFWADGDDLMPQSLYTSRTPLKAGGLCTVPILLGIGSIWFANFWADGDDLMPQSLYALRTPLKSGGLCTVPILPGIGPIGFASFLGRLDLIGIRTRRLAGLSPIRTVFAKLDGFLGFNENPSLIA